MPINPIVAVLPVPQAPLQQALPAGASSMASLVQEAIEQEGGGHGGGHGMRKPSLDAIAQIAAGANAKPKPRLKTVAERQAAIDRMKRERNDPSQRDAADEREETPEQRARRNPLLVLF